MKKEKQNGNNGSEIHRLKPMQKYDETVFNRLYTICKPVIKKLVYQIDSRRFNVTDDIITSYFWDKMLYVFNKYYGTCEFEHLKARILASLSIYKNHLLKSAYGEAADYHKSLYLLEDLLDKDKELEDLDEEEKAKTEMLELLYSYMRSHLSPDAFLIFEISMSPPPYIKERITEGGRITNLILVDFFDMPKTKSSIKYISELKEDIKYWEDKAKEELKY